MVKIKVTYLYKSVKGRFFQSARSGPDCPWWINFFDRPFVVHQGPSNNQDDHGPTVCDRLSLFRYPTLAKMRPIDQKKDGTIWTKTILGEMLLNSLYVHCDCIITRSSGSTGYIHATLVQIFNATSFTYVNKCPTHRHWYQSVFLVLLL